MVRVEQMTDHDAGFAQDLSTAEGWGFYAVDFRRMVALDPAGCFIARQADRRVGMVCTVSYGTHAFIGCLIVLREARGRDVGLRLMQAAIGFLDKKNITTIELDGVIAAVPMYRKLGFKDKYLSCRLARSGQNSPETAAPSWSGDSDEILRYDLAKTGIERGTVLHKLLQEYPDGVCTVHHHGIAGYGMIRRREGGFYMIGPLVADNDRIAGELMQRLLCRAEDERVAIGVPGTRPTAVDVMLDHGFYYTQPSLRMYRGERIDYESHIYCILGPEKG